MPPPREPLRRIGYLSPCWPPERLPSGIAAYVRTVADGLRSIGVAADIYSLTGVLPDDVRDDVFDLSGLMPEESSGLAQLITRFRQIRNMADLTADRFGSALSRAIQALPHNRRPQVLEVEETFGIASWVRTPGIPVVIRLHGPWFLNGPLYGLPLDRQFRLRCATEYRAARRASGISAPSRFVLTEFLRKIGHTDAPVAVIPNPVAPVARELRWNPPRDGVQRILYIGRFERIKGPDIALQAFAQVQQQAPNVELDFAGSDDGFVDDEGRTWGIREYVAARLPPAAASRVRFLGKLPQAKLDELRRDCRVAIVASRNETFSITAMEFMSAGVPTVAPAVGGIPEIIENGKTGLLFPVGQATALADAVLRLLRDSALSAQLGEAARVASGQFEPVSIARRSLQFHELVIDTAARQTS